MHFTQSGGLGLASVKIQLNKTKSYEMHHIEHEIENAYPQTQIWQMHLFVIAIKFRFFDSSSWNPKYVYFSNSTAYFVVVVAEYVCG